MTDPCQPPPPDDAPPGTGAAPAPFRARIEPEGRQFDAPARLPLLVAAEHAGLAPLSSCRNGTCRTCICLLHSGQVRYRIEWPGVSAEEKAEGWILPCVAYPASDVVLQWPFA
jgi:ferredoxin